MLCLDSEELMGRWGQSQASQRNKQETVQNGVAPGPLTPTSPPCLPAPSKQVGAAFWFLGSKLVFAAP